MSILGTQGFVLVQNGITYNITITIPAGCSAVAVVVAASTTNTGDGGATFGGLPMTTLRTSGYAASPTAQPRLFRVHWVNVSGLPAGDHTLALNYQYSSTRRLAGIVAFLSDTTVALGSLYQLAYDTGETVSEAADGHVLAFTAFASTATPSNSGGELVALQTSDDATFKVGIYHTIGSDPMIITYSATVKNYIQTATVSGTPVFQRWPRGGVTDQIATF